jgi:hypothetical protein
MYFRPPTSVHPDSPVHVVSANLTRIGNALGARRENRLNVGAKKRRAMSRLRPDIGPSVIRYERPVEKATIDLTDRRPVPGKIETPGAIDEAARFADDVARIERGESLEVRADAQAEMNNFDREAQAIEVVIERLESEFQAEFMKLATEHCARLRPSVEKKTKRFFELFAEAFAIYSDLSKTKQDLVDSQMPTMCFDVSLDFMRGNDIARAFADGKAAGLCEVPKALRG